MMSLKLSVINSRAVKILAAHGWEPEEHFGEKINRFVNKGRPGESITVFPSGSGYPIHFEHKFEGQRISGLQDYLTDINSRE